MPGYCSVHRHFSRRHFRRPWQAHPHSALGSLLCSPFHHAPSFAAYFAAIFCNISRHFFRNVLSQTMCLKRRTISNSCRWFRTVKNKYTCRNFRYCQNRNLCLSLPFKHGPTSCTGPPSFSPAAPWPF